MIVFHHADVKNNYTVVKNEIILDERISWKAKGLFTYVLSRPGTWEISIADLVNRSKDGRDSVYGAIRELLDLGYLTKEQDNKGTFNKVIYHVFQEPRSNSTQNQQHSPLTGNPYTENPYTENPTQVSTKRVSTKRSNKKKKRLKEKEKPTLEEREQLFREEVWSFKRDPDKDEEGKYKIATLKSFFNYWSEPNHSGKMRKELQKTWDTKRRLVTWDANESQFTKQPFQNSNGGFEDDRELILKERKLRERTWENNGDNPATPEEIKDIMSKAKWGSQSD